MFIIKNYKLLLSGFIALTFVFANVFSPVVSAKELDTDITNTYYIGDTKINVTDRNTDVKVDVYVNDILDHTSIVERETGNIKEKKNGKEKKSNISEFVSNGKIDNTYIDESLQSINSPVSLAGPVEPGDEGDTAPYGFSYLASWYGHIGSPYLSGYLWGKSYTTSGPAKHLSFTKGTLIGTISGILVGFLKGVNVTGVINALGGSITGAVIGSAIDGNIYAVDYYTDLKATVNNTVYLSTYRFTRYSRTTNLTTGYTQELYIGQYGNWNDSTYLIHSAIGNYLAAH